MKHDKLVRDKIPEIIRATGRTPVTHAASDAEYWQKLREKLQEEVAEYLDSESIEEIADILEVIEALVALRGWKKEDIEESKRKKFEERGGFAKKIILEES